MMRTMKKFLKIGRISVVDLKKNEGKHENIDYQCIDGNQTLELSVQNVGNGISVS